MEISDSDSWQNLHPNIIWAERASGMIFGAILALFIVGLVIFFGISAYTTGSIILGLLAVMIVMLFALILAWLWLWPGWTYRHTKWRQVNHGFEIQHGMLWKHRVFVPRERIQHTDVIRGPIMRRFKLATLVIHTAGSHNHQVLLEGLEEGQAEHLRQALLPDNALRTAANGMTEDHNAATCTEAQSPNDATTSTAGGSTLNAATASEIASPTVTDAASAISDSQSAANSDTNPQNSQAQA